MKKLSMRMARENMQIDPFKHEEVKAKDIEICQRKKEGNIQVNRRNE